MAYGIILIDWVIPSYWDITLYLTKDNILGILPLEIMFEWQYGNQPVKPIIERKKNVKNTRILSNLNACIMLLFMFFPAIEMALGQFHVIDRHHHMKLLAYISAGADMGAIIMLCLRMKYFGGWNYIYLIISILWVAFLAVDLGTAITLKTWV